MESKIILKNIIDALLVFLISFGSVAIAMQEITTKALIIAAITSLLVALIKFRAFWETKVMITFIL